MTQIRREPVDRYLATAQHAAYVAAQRWRPVHVPPGGAPYLADAVVVAGRLAVLTRPGPSERRPEVDSVEQAVRDLGLNAVRITWPDTLDGDDVPQVGADQRRRHRPAHRAAARMAGGPRRAASVLHLKSAVIALPGGILIGGPAHARLSDLLVPPEERARTSSCSAATRS